MLKNITIRWLLKIIIAIISFSLIFFTIQPFFVMQSDFEAIAMIKGYSYLEKNSVDVLFIGPSQMYYTVDAGKLTSEYGIKSFDFGSSGQPLPTTSYYLDEALKTQTPKLVALEICNVFIKNSDIPKSTLVYCYFPMPMSLKKFDSLHNSLNVDFKKSFEYAFTPLFLFHDRWKNIYLNDIDFVLNSDDYIDLGARGYLKIDNINRQSIDYYNGDETIRDIPEECKKAILDIREKSKEKGIKLLLFKAPTANWTKGDSMSVKKFAKENDLEFIDLNEKLDEIGIDENTDFLNKSHLNSSGAAKTTDYLAKILPAYIN